MVIPLSPLLFLHPPKGTVFMWALCSRQQVCSRLKGQGSAYRDTSRLLKSRNLERGHGVDVAASTKKELMGWQMEWVKHETKSHGGG